MGALASAARCRAGCPHSASTARQRRRWRPAARAPPVCAAGGGSEPAAPAVIDPLTFLATGTLGNVGMAVAGTLLGDWQGLDVSGQLRTAPDLQSALGFTLPLLALCGWGVANAERVAGLGELKRVFQQSLLPQLEALPAWGLGLLALGAGVGEEALFRGFVQPAAAGGIAGLTPGLAPAAAGAAAIAGTSLVFGALHALTPAYFAFACAGSVLFGVEYELCGLPAAALTHFMYDCAALALVIRQWGGGGGGEAGGDGGEGGDGGGGETGSSTAS